MKSVQELARDGVVVHSYFQSQQAQRDRRKERKRGERLNIKGDRDRLRET